MSSLLFKLAKWVEKKAPTPSVPRWTHADKIRELQTDEYVSGEYLAKLINASRKKEDLNEIARYLNDERKVANLKPSELAQLKTKLTEKMDLIDMKALLKHFRENGTLDFAHWFDLFL